jgi:hypothetical protein
MTVPGNASLEAETIRRLAREQIRLPLTPAEVDALQTLLNSLLNEIQQVTLHDRSGAEPEPSVTVEEWPR